ncbi:hypothetical protein LTR85_006926 [Meristemomyces frigidus]|nr:hypothetical protein LTR85_006926 [Meristemomyces frigidus]
MSVLLSGPTVTITAKASPDSDVAFTITVPRALVCTLSEHFARAFATGSFIEGEESAAVLEDVEPWVLRVFGGWLFTQQLAYQQGGPEGMVDEALAQIVDKAGPEHEIEAADPVTWPWEALFAVYQFADQYHTRRLRQAVLEIVQIKTLQLQPKVYHLPNPATIAFAANNLPDTSPLRRFLLDVFVHAEAENFHKHGASDIAECSARELAILPSDFLAEGYKLMQRVRAAEECISCTPPRRVSGSCLGVHGHTEEDTYTPREREWCAWHEHDGAEEIQECLAREQAVRWRLGYAGIGGRGIR